MPLHEDTTRSIDARVAAAQSEARAPSLIVGVVRDGGLVHVAAAGETPVPTPDTQYRLGSITKTMTAMLVMRLRDEGRLALDDPIDRHLPGTPVGAATVRQLLGHASGLRREPAGPWWERAAGTSLESLLDDLDPDMLVHPPYRTFHYSNVAYALLAAAASRITGESWSDLVGKRLLTPLGMRRTTYQCEEPYALGYVVHPWLDTMREEPRHDSGAMAPAGQLWSTVADLARWAAFVADPDPEVINPGTVAEMAAPVILTDPDTWSGGYGLGFQLVRRGERILVGHGGSMPGYVAFVAVHRQSGTAALTFCNAYNAPVALSSLCGEVIDTVLD
ncbi:MAG: serine hydrolase domain-containing protein, partial [Micromonosporaceae bacterium]